MNSELLYYPCAEILADLFLADWHQLRVSLCCHSFAWGGIQIPFVCTMSVSRIGIVYTELLDGTGANGSMLNCPCN